MNKISISLLAAGLFATLSACSNDDSKKEQRCETPSAVNPPINEVFNIEVGSTVSVDDGGLQVTFVGVDGDSRCPSDVQCVTAGSAIIRLTGQPTGRDAETFTLETDTDTSQTLAFDNGFYQIELSEVEPYPISTREIADDGYCVTLTVAKALE